jgi:hypothetical protein
MVKAEQGYVKLVSLFERELFRYRPHYTKEDFSIQYIIQKRRFSKLYDIQLLIQIKNRKIWREFRSNPNEFKKSIKRFATIFSIDEVRIIRSSEFPPLPTEEQPIEKRVSFEYYNL